MNKQQHEILREIFDSADEGYLFDHFVEDTENIIECIEVVDETRVRPVRLREELDHLASVIKKLSMQARFHLMYDKDGKLYSPKDSPVKIISESINRLYEVPDTRLHKTMYRARLAENVMDSYGIPCTSAKNGHFVKYLGVIKELSVEKFDPYTMARTYFKIT